MTIAVVACLLQVALGREFSADPKDSPADHLQGEVKVHGVPSVPLSPQEIKDAYHEPAVVMAEVQRLKRLGNNGAVLAIVEGTAKLAAGHKPASKVIDDLAFSFSTAMRGYTFLDIQDVQRPENNRYRKALYVASCASLSAEAQARAAASTASEN